MRYHQQSSVGRTFSMSCTAALSISVLCAPELAEAGEGSEQGTQRIGLQRRSVHSSNLRSLLQRSISAAAHNSSVVPKPNDTVSPAYWSKVNTALGQYSAPELGKSLNDPPPSPEPKAWEKIFRASQKVNIVDTPNQLSEYTNWEYATPMPDGEASKAGSTRTLGVVPYDMQVGAHIMYSLSEKNTETPPPTQLYVEQAFVAACPMIMFGGGLQILGPRCGDHMGAWADPATDRAVLRWKTTPRGGVYFGVDSAVDGEGSAYFGMFEEQLTLNRYQFQLFNCLQVMRYIVEEEVIKMDHMAPKAYSTMLAHGVGGSKEAYFYKYSIRHPNGTTVAETTMYRLDQNELNFTMLKDGLSTGAVFATAKRQGRWKRNGWQECTGSKRGWEMQFHQDERSFATVATVQDLRVAAAATLTLLALRDEDVSSDGFQHTGQSSLYWTMIKAFFEIFWIFFVLCIVTLVVQKKGWDKKMRRFLFRFEAFLFPRRPVKARLPVLNPSY